MWKKKEKNTHIQSEARKKMRAHMCIPKNTHKIDRKKKFHSVLHGNESFVNK